LLYPLLINSRMKENSNRQNNTSSLKRIVSNSFSLSEIDAEIEKLVAEYRQINKGKMEYENTYSKWS